MLSNDLRQTATENKTKRDTATRSSGCRLR